ncbi:hypothetical protein LWI29_035667 [Acer saccharum]|uniref:Uncharacterized protein n=1 Tax=Acer saccharum TaxID=4024 RepID=A0AA39S4I1_ACESA|nr:hypothetical protein LWI29_035667 [Acer saccharum]
MENEPSCFMISRWFTSMVGQILNLKILTSKLWEVGATVVKTTEFVQGQACRWGLAWTFMPTTRKRISPHVIEKKNSSFMLEITASKDHCNAILKNEVNDVDEAPSDKHLQETSSSSSCFHVPLNYLSFCVAVFQQIPGTLLVKGSLQH